MEFPDNYSSGSSSDSSVTVNALRFTRNDGDDTDHCTSSNLHLFSPPFISHHHHHLHHKPCSTSDDARSSVSGVFQGRGHLPSSFEAPAVRTARLSLVISTVTLLFLVFFCGWLLLFSEAAPFSKAPGVDASTRVCVPCVQVSPDPLEDSRSLSSSSSVAEMWSQLEVTYDDGDNQTGATCCAASPAQYAVLFKLILSRQQEVQKLADSLDSPVALPLEQQVSDAQPSISAHLVFKPPPQRTPETRDDYEQQWKSPSESPLSHLQGGLKLHRGHRILIHTPGLYYVYCQLLFNPSHPSSPLHTTASAYVRRYSILRPAAPDFLLKSRHTRYDVAEDRHSSHVGGVFRLYKGDSLVVLVSRPELVSYDDVASFFGLFRIGG